MLGVAEHRGTELGVVAAHALEHSRAVVQAVRQDVDLGVLPGDEFSVHPDEVGGVHVHCAPLRGGRALLRRLRRAHRPSEVGGAQTRSQRAFNGRFYSRRLAFQTQAVPQHHRGGEEHRQRVGGALPGDVGAEPCTGSNMPGAIPAQRGAREHPDRAGEHRGLVGEDVAEHVLRQDRVEVARRWRRAASRRCRRARARAGCGRTRARATR